MNPNPYEVSEPELLRGLRVSWRGGFLRDRPLILSFRFGRSCSVREVLLAPPKSPGATSARTSSNTSSRLLSGSPTPEVGGTGSFKTLSLHSDAVNSSSRTAPEQKIRCTHLGYFTFVGGRPWSPKEVHYYPPSAIPNGSSRTVSLDKKTTEHDPRFPPQMTAFPAPDRASGSLPPPRP